QESLKADYLDGELSQREQEQIREHLGRCLGCRKLQEELESQRMLFKQAGRVSEVPARVWQNIRDTIISGRLNEESRARGGILERLRDSLWQPRPALALASVFAVLILAVVLTGTFIRREQSLSSENEAQTLAAYSLSSDNGDLIYDLGTNVEEYFL
ncbi:hypothetical protein D4Q80_01370, partial [bacterium]